MSPTASTASTDPVALAQRLGLAVASVAALRDADRAALAAWADAQAKRPRAASRPKLGRVATLTPHTAATRWAWLARLDAATAACAGDDFASAVPAAVVRLAESDAQRAALAERAALAHSERTAKGKPTSAAWAAISAIAAMGRSVAGVAPAAEAVA